MVMYKWCFKASIAFAVVMSAWAIYTHFEVHIATSPVPNCQACGPYREVRRLRLAASSDESGTAAVAALLHRAMMDRLPVILTPAEPEPDNDSSRGESFLKLLREIYPKVPQSAVREFGSRSWPPPLQAEGSSCEAARLPRLVRGRVIETKYTVLKGKGYGVGKVFLPQLEAREAFLGLTPTSLPPALPPGPGAAAGGGGGRRGQADSEADSGSSTGASTGALLDARNDSWYFGWRLPRGNALHQAIAEQLGLNTRINPRILRHGRVLASEQWIFIANVPPSKGLDPPPPPLCGAGRHVDRVSAASSIHFQLAGRKEWTLWPHPTCASSCNPLSVEVGPGEIFIVSNDVWDHSTRIPPPRRGEDAAGGLSVSVEIQYDPPRTPYITLQGGAGGEL